MTFSIQRATKATDSLQAYLISDIPQECVLALFVPKGDGGLHEILGS